MANMVHDRVNPSLEQLKSLLIIKRRRGIVNSIFKRDYSITQR